MPSFGFGVSRSTNAPMSGSKATGKKKGVAAAADSSTNRNLIAQVLLEFGSDFVDTSFRRQAHMDDHSITTSSILRVPVGVRGVDITQQALAGYFLDSWKAKRHAMFTRRNNEDAVDGDGPISEESVRHSSSEETNFRGNDGSNYADITRLIIDCEVEKALYDNSPSSVNNASTTGGDGNVYHHIQGNNSDGPDAVPLTSEKLLDNPNARREDWESSDIVNEVLLRNFGDLLVITRPDPTITEGTLASTAQRSATVQAALQTTSSSLTSLVQLITGQCSGMLEVRILADVEAEYVSWVQKQNVLAQLRGSNITSGEGASDSESAGGNLSVHSSPGTSPVHTSSASPSSSLKPKTNNKNASPLAPPQDYPLQWLAILDSVITRVIKVAQTKGVNGPTSSPQDQQQYGGGSGSDGFADEHEASRVSMLSDIVPLAPHDAMNIGEDTDIVSSAKHALLRGLVLEFLLHYMTSLPSRYVEDYTLFVCAPDGSILPNHVDIARDFIVPRVLQPEEDSNSASSSSNSTNNPNSGNSHTSPKNNNQNRQSVITGFVHALDHEATRGALVKHITHTLQQREVHPAQKLLEHSMVAFPYTFRLVFTPRRSMTGGITKSSKRMEDSTVFGIRTSNLVPEVLLPPPEDPFAPGSISPNQVRLERFRAAVGLELRTVWMARGSSSDGGIGGGSSSVLLPLGGGVPHPTPSMSYSSSHENHQSTTPIAIRTKSSATTDTALNVYHAVTGATSTTPLGGESELNSPTASISPRSAALAVTAGMRPRKTGGLVDDEIAAAKSAHLLSFLPRLVVPTAFLRQRRQEALSRLGSMLQAEVVGGDAGAGMSESCVGASESRGDVAFMMRAPVNPTKTLTLRRRAAQNVRSVYMKKRGLFSVQDPSISMEESDPYGNKDYPDRPSNKPRPREQQQIIPSYSGEEEDLAVLDVFLDDLMEDAGITMYDLARFGGNHSSVAAITREAKRFCREEAPKMVLEDRVQQREANISRAIDRRGRSEKIRLEESKVKILSLREEKMDLERAKKEQEARTELQRAEEKHSYFVEAQRRKMTEQEKKQQHLDELQKKREEDKIRREELARDVDKRLKSKELRRTIENARLSNGDVYNPDNSLCMYVENNLRPELRKLNAAERQALISEELSGQLNRNVQAAKEFQTGTAEGSKDSRSKMKEFVVEETFTQQIERTAQDRKRNERRAARAREALASRTFPLGLASELRPYDPN